MSLLVRPEPFSTDFNRLRNGIDPDRIDASFHDGVLEVTIPKPEQRKPRLIAVSGNGEHATIEGSSTGS
jgi:HSP20 family protein